MSRVPSWATTQGATSRASRAHPLFPHLRLDRVQACPLGQQGAADRRCYYQLYRQLFGAQGVEYGLTSTAPSKLTSRNIIGTRHASLYEARRQSIRRSIEMRESAGISHNTDDLHPCCNGHLPGAHVLLLLVHSQASVATCCIPPTFARSVVTDAPLPLPPFWGCHSSTVRSSGALGPTLFFVRFLAQAVAYSHHTPPRDTSSQGDTVHALAPPCDTHPATLCYSACMPVTLWHTSTPPGGEGYPFSGWH